MVLIGMSGVVAALPQECDADVVNASTGLEPRSPPAYGDLSVVIRGILYFSPLTGPESLLQYRGLAYKFLHLKRKLDSYLLESPCPPA